MALSNERSSQEPPSEERITLHAELIGLIRRLIAGSILFNQQVADKVGLGLTDMQCINILDLLGPTTPGKLAQSTGLTTGGVTVMLDRLEKAGFVKRAPNPNDRRSILVRVNQAKLKKVHGYYDEINRRMEQLFLETAERDLERVAKFLARMVETRS
jgi:MarR family transcriptional regulator, organic hydroperoxide resistance regulator